MGTFASSTQVYLGDQPALEIRSQLRKWMRDRLDSLGYVEVDISDANIDRVITIGQAEQEPWITIYDEGDQPANVAESISQNLRLTTVSIELHDSDVLMLGLFKEGVRVDYFNSAPDYFEEKVSKVQRKTASGQPELWRDLLLPDTTPSQLRKVWGSQPLFADDILVGTAQLTGMNIDLLLESPDVEGMEGTERFAFQLKEQPDYRIKAVGPPRFQLTSYTDTHTFSEGDTFNIHLNVRNLGGAANGLAVVVWGEALDQDVIGAESVRLVSHNTGEVVTAQFEAIQVREGGREVTTYVARLENFQLPQGVAASSDISTGANWRQSYEAVHKTTITSIIYCKTLKPGQSQVLMGLVPLSNHKGQVAHRMWLDISPRARQPLRYNKDRPASTYLRFMEQPRRLVGLASLGINQMAAAEIASQAIEKWHEAIAPLGHGQYRVVIFSGLGGKPQTKKIGVGKFLTSRQWIKCRESLFTASIVTGTLPSGAVDADGPPIDTGSGFTFGPGLFSSALGVERFSPHIGFWADLQVSGAGALEGRLRDIIDGVMVRASGHQAFIARWNWATQAAVDSTPYETACGLGGQCTTLHDWCTRFLRAVSNELWLGPSLLERLGDRHGIETVAELRQIGNGLHLSLKQDADLNQLESALESLLPSTEDWQDGMQHLYARQS